MTDRQTDRQMDRQGDYYRAFAYCLMMLYICTKFHQNMLKDFRASEGLNFQYSKYSKGHNSVKMYVEVWSLFSANRLIMRFICTKFHEKI